MSLVKSGITWLRQAVAMSNSWPSWQERLVLALFLLIAVGLGFVTASIELWKAAIVWGVYFIAMAVCSRQGWLQLFGPVLFYDMVRTARRSRYVIMRLLYSLLLLGILIVMFMQAERRHFNERDRQQRDAAVMAQEFFSYFMIVQLAMVVLLTPAYVAGAIAEEKDRKTLEFMLATDLNNREIILSKLLSRVGNMTLLLLTGLPILSILQFMGGVDSELMLAGFAATGLTMLGIASVGILLSTLFQKPRDAISLTYLFIVTYLALATTTLVMEDRFRPGRSWMDEEILYEDGPTWRDASKALNAGNPIAALVGVGHAMERASLGADLPGIVRGYAWFHGVLSLVCVGWSIYRLRTIALKQTVGGKTARLSWWERYRPPIGELPMMWKELNIEGRMKLNWLAWGFVVILVVLTLGFGLLIVGVCLWDLALGGHPEWRELPQRTNHWFRVAGTGVGSLMILMVAVRASTCISSERERDTFDALITTPMSGDAMLGAKLLGCITCMRMGWLWFGTMLTVAVLSGGIHLLAVPLVITEWFVYAVFFAMVGMGFSMSCQSSMRATVYTVLTTLMLGGGHWLVMGLCCYIPAATLMRGGNPGSFLEYLMKFQAGMTPPFVMGLSAYSWDDLGRNFNRREFGEVIAFCLVGLFLWAMGSLILWYGVLVPKFRLITRREELIYQYESSHG
jgi:ABC-type transport system involved in multi-copper enzyme maturation permease subunit